MVHRGIARLGSRPGARLVVALLLALACVASVVAVQGWASRVAGSGLSRCERFAADGVARAELVTGSGPDLLVIGDSWSVGLGLRDPAASWPSRLPGRVHVAGFSGSGFSAHASGCGAVSFADRAAAALRQLPAGTPVVVEGGLNDWDRTDAEITAGFTRLMSVLRGHPVTVVGPASAPSRAAYTPRVGLLLRSLCTANGVAYIDPSALRLDYLTDLLHPTEVGHRAFGDFVAARL